MNKVLTLLIVTISLVACSKKETIEENNNQAIEQLTDRLAQKQWRTNGYIKENSRAIGEKKYLLIDSIVAIQKIAATTISFLGERYTNTDGTLIQNSGGQKVIKYIYDDTDPYVNAELYYYYSDDSIHLSYRAIGSSFSTLKEITAQP